MSVPAGAPVNAILGAQPGGVTLFSAKESCLDENPAPTWHALPAENSAEQLGILDAGRNDNLLLSLWQGDDGTNSDLNVINGPNTIGSDLLSNQN